MVEHNTSQTKRNVPYLTLVIEAPLQMIIGATLGAAFGAVQSVVAVSSLKRLIIPGLEQTLEVLEKGSFGPPLAKGEFNSQSLKDRISNFYGGESSLAFIPVGMLAAAATAVYGLTQQEMRPYSLGWLATNAISVLLEAGVYVGARRSKSSASKSLSPQ